MPTLLHLDSSADLKHSTSRALTARFATAWTGISTDHLVVRRDLHLDPPPHLPTDALHWAPRLRRPDDVVPAEAERLQQVLINELLNADAVLIGAPMYNWGVPSTLKAWIDHVHVGGVTSPIDGPTQPLAGKPVVVVSSRGGSHGPGAATDNQVPSLVQVLHNSMGMDVTAVTVDLTLAGRLPALKELTGPAAEELARAGRELDDLARKLGG